MSPKYLKVYFIKSFSFLESKSISRTSKTIPSVNAAMMSPAALLVVFVN